MHPAVPTYIPFVSAVLTVSLAGRLQVYSKVVFKPATHQLNTHHSTILLVKPDGKPRACKRWSKVKKRRSQRK